MHAGIEWRSERRAVGGAPTGAYGIDLHGGIGTAVFVEARKSHERSVAQIGDCRIPAPMGHILNIGELAGRRIINGATRLSVERVVLQSTSVDECAAIRENYQTVAKHIPADRLSG